MNVKSACRTLTLCLSLGLAACGGGSGSTGSSAAATPDGTYTSAAVPGELLDYTIDTKKLTYSYTITDSDFGLTGQGGSGDLVDNKDGTYSPTGSPNVKIFPVQNGMLLGSVSLNIGGTTEVVPIIGFKNRITSMSDLQGTYNYVQRLCDGAGTGCSADYGTFVINADGTWSSCSQEDLSTIACPFNHNARSGTLNALNDGTWQILAQSGQAIGTGLAFKATNGQNVWVVDFNNPVANGGAGVGILAGSIKSVITSTDTNGTWLFGGTTSNAQYVGSLTVNGDSYTSAGLVLSGGGVFPVGSSEQIARNNPWNGMVAVTSITGGYAILAGAGMYASVNTQLGAIEVGLRR